MSCVALLIWAHKKKVRHAQSWMCEIPDHVSGELKCAAARMHGASGSSLCRYFYFEARMDLNSVILQ